jgi:AhpD family alkylhydroperoxidase
MGAILARATSRGTLAQVRHITPVRPDLAQGLVGRVYAQLERDFGLFAPPIILHSPAPDVLAACWSMLRETLLAGGRVGRTTKEAVATAVSLGNICPYCVEVHGSTLHGLARGHDAAAVMAGRIESITDPHVREIAAWARTLGDQKTARPVPFPVEQAPELIGVALTFHYLNRMVNVFLGESLFPQGVPAGARARLLRLIGRLMRPMTRRTRKPGASLELLPTAPLPEDLSWAAGDPDVAGALARAAAAIETAGERSVPKPVRDLVTARLAEWDGRPLGPSRSWADDAVSRLPVAQRPAGRLALLTALASYQVGQTVIDDLRRDQPVDETLIELTSWASMTAARHVVGPAMGAAHRRPSAG